MINLESYRHEPIIQKSKLIGEGTWLLLH